MAKRDTWCYFLLAALAGCSASTDGSELLLRLQTDLLPGVEFDSITVHVRDKASSLGFRQSRGAGESSFLPSGSAFELDDLPTGDYRVELILGQSWVNRPLSIRPLDVTLRQNLVATVPVDRSCLNVRCPPVDNPETAEDESLLIACFAGQCVDPRCSVESPEYCGDISLCEVAADCPTPVSCAEAACYDGLCWASPKQEGDAGACGEGLYCQPELGCSEPTASRVATCSDGLRNGLEDGVDCGGPCPALCGDTFDVLDESCLNGVKDGSEEAIDCGGTCTPCRSDTYDCTGQNDIPIHECHALLTVLEELHLDTTREVWQDGGAPCTWTGIVCEDGHVVDIGVVGVEAYGEIPEALYNLNKLQELSFTTCVNVTGTLSPAIGRLTELNTVLISSTGLSGPIPEEIGQLEKLDMLFLRASNFTGTIPPSIGNLSLLDYLVVERTLLTGTIPPSLANLSRLETLGLSRNGLEGTIPLGFGDLSALKWLRLSNNRLEGAVPVGLNDSRPYLEIAVNDCLWVTECGAFKTWLDGEDAGWDSPSAPGCNPPPEACP